MIQELQNGTGVSARAASAALKLSYRRLLR